MDKKKNLLGRFFLKNYKAESQSYSDHHKRTTTRRRKIREVYQARYAGNILGSLVMIIVMINMIVFLNIVCGNIWQVREILKNLKKFQ